MRREESEQGYAGHSVPLRTYSSLALVIATELQSRRHYEAYETTALSRCDSPSPLVLTEKS